MPPSTNNKWSSADDLSLLLSDKTSVSVDVIPFKWMLHHCVLCKGSATWPGGWWGRQTSARCESAESVHNTWRRSAEHLCEWGEKTGSCCCVSLSGSSPLYQLMFSLNVQGSFNKMIFRFFLLSVYLFLHSSILMSDWWERIKLTECNRICFIKLNTILQSNSSRDVCLSRLWLRYLENCLEQFLHSY